MNHNQLLGLNQFSQIIFIYIDSSPRVQIGRKTTPQILQILYHSYQASLHTTFRFIFIVIFFLFLFANCHAGLIGGKSLGFKHHHNLMFWDSSTTHVSEHCRLTPRWLHIQKNEQKSQNMADLCPTSLPMAGNIHDLYNPQFSHLKLEMINLIEFKLYKKKTNM